MNAQPPAISFIGIVDFSQDAKWLFMTDSVTDLLGYEPSELIGQPSLNLVHPDEFPSIRQLHYDTIQQDKAAVLVYLRMKHKDPFRGYVLCGVSRTVVHNVLVGSVSFASPGAKALHNASTAQEITVITPSAANFQFRRWHDPSPMPPSPIPQEMANLGDLLRTSPAPSSSSWGSKSRESQSPPVHSPTLSTLSSPAEERERDRNGRDAGRESENARNGRETETERERERERGSRSRSRSESRSPSASRERTHGLSHRTRPGTEHGHALARNNGYSNGSHPSASSASASTAGAASPRTLHSALQIPIISFDPPPNKSFRTAFILDRFTTSCTIMYCSNDLLVSTTEAIGRSFYDFVSRRDEDIVRSWIECVKGWGVNEKGQPSDGGFGFGKFMLVAEGRDAGASRRIPEPPMPSRHRDRHSQAHHHTSHPHQRRPSNNPHGHSRPTPRARASTHSSASASAYSPTSPYPASSASTQPSSAYSPGSSPTSTRHSPTSARGPYHRDGHGHGQGQSTAQLTQSMHTMNVHGTDDAHAERFEVDAIFSAHSDGLMVILRRAS